LSFPRASGILLHPTSLPSRGGIGDFGPSAYEFADFLASARQGLWQVLPLGPLGFGNSPYSSTSAFAGNPLLISLERLADRGWIGHDQVDALEGGAGPVDYPAVFHQKLPLLFEAARNFVRSAAPNARSRYESFCRENGWWLDDFVLFDGLRARFKLESWNRWPRALTHREPAAIEKAHAEMLDDLDVRRAVQFFFFEQWQALRAYCAQHSIRVAGDIAIFVNFDSADVWT
jgi:4-alpha-glucanotransferase